MQSVIPSGAPLLAWLAGGLCGGVAAGTAAVALASLTTLGGWVLVATVGLSIWGGAVVGGLVAGTLARGNEQELAQLYDPSVARGKILVTAEEFDPKRQAMLDRATQILASHGVGPLPLPNG